MHTRIQGYISPTRAALGWKLATAPVATLAATDGRRPRQLRPAGGSGSYWRPAGGRGSYRRPATVAATDGRRSYWRPAAAANFQPQQLLGTHQRSGGKRVESTTLMNLPCEHRSTPSSR
ncbi:unnamed protein product [Pleuronectes platessa]|uniref:Uncharacterized protein n=1 Tax=Pleuronectes platessa TaxID=8262 RepID=A0A9N7U862_PLEPL|nr:unnamed protein product [Pleuronectes platessa]